MISSCPICTMIMKKLASFSGLPLSSILEAARSANAEALLGDGRPSANYILPELNAFYLGELMFYAVLVYCL